MESIWQKGLPRVRFSELDGRKNTDILIIGGGIAGILCAHELKRRGADFILAEADEICSGITKNTTAKLSVMHGLLYDRLTRRFGEDKAKLYFEAQKDAREAICRLSENIDCDLERRDSYVYSLCDEKAIEKEVAAIKRLGADAEFSECSELPVSTVGAVRMRGEAQFHPLKFLYSIARELPIYEHTKVVELKRGVAVTSRGEINYKQLIIATHFPIINKHGGYFMKLYQHRSYVIALRGAKALSGMYVDESETGLSFRNYGELLLLGGGGHRTGKRGGGWRELEDFALRHYKGASIVGRWATQDCITLDGMPYIGEYSRATEGVFVATGFNKWGMTNAMVAANLLSELLDGRRSALSELLSPGRSVFRPQLFKNAFESVKGLISFTAPRCPHLGCALKYNAAEHSWDCPCHGSRFTESGELIDNPATDDKRF